VHLIIKLCLSFSRTDQSKLIPHLSCIWNTLLPDKIKKHIQVVEVDSHASLLNYDSLGHIIASAI
jgi:hypothetical protein